MASAQALHAVVHTPEAVREIIEQAVSIAHEYAADEAVAALVFGKACDLLGQRATAFIQQAPLSLALDRPLDLRR